MRLPDRVVKGFNKRGRVFGKQPCLTLPCDTVEKEGDIPGKKMHHGQAHPCTVWT
jgi:hypothetical protein